MSTNLPIDDPVILNILKLPREGNLYEYQLRAGDHVIFHRLGDPSHYREEDIVRSLIRGHFVGSPISS